MSTPDPRTEAAKMLVSQMLNFIETCSRRKLRFSSIVNLQTGETSDPTDRLVQAVVDALTTEAARVRGETWREAEQYANECEAVNTERGSILAWHKMAAHCRMQAKNLPTNQPTWSTARPTVEGFYWYRDDEVGPTVVEVYEVAGALAVDQFDRGSGLPLKAFNGEWCPIARPGEREEW